MKNSLVNDLRVFANEDQEAVAVFKWLSVLERHREESSIASISREANVVYGDAVYVMKRLSELGVGSFIVGRKGKKSRFEFWCNRIILGKVALGESEELELFTEDEIARVDNKTRKKLISTHRKLLALALGVDKTKVKIKCLV